jgi:hypothetical protein
MAQILDRVGADLRLLPSLPTEGTEAEDLGRMTWQQQQQLGPFAAGGVSAGGGITTAEAEAGSIRSKALKIRLEARLSQVIFVAPKPSQEAVTIPHPAGSSKCSLGSKQVKGTPRASPDNYLALFIRRTKPDLPPMLSIVAGGLDSGDACSSNPQPQALSQDMQHK